MNQLFEFLNTGNGFLTMFLVLMGIIIMGPLVGIVILDQYNGHNNIAPQCPHYLKHLNGGIECLAK